MFLVALDDDTQIHRNNNFHTFPSAVLVLFRFVFLLQSTRVICCIVLDLQLVKHGKKLCFHALNALM